MIHFLFNSTSPKFWPSSHCLYSSWFRDLNREDISKKDSEIHLIRKLVENVERKYIGLVNSNAAVTCFKYINSQSITYLGHVFKQKRSWCMKLWQKGNSRYIFLFVFTLDIWEPEQDQYDSNIVINKNQCKCQKSLRIHILSCYSLLLLLLVFF